MYLPALSLLVLCLFAASDAKAAPGMVADNAAAMSSAATTAPVAIAPHRAIYAMTLTSSKNGSNIADVDGSMVFEWADTCDGWAVQQQLRLHFDYAEGEKSTIASNEVSWESKDGKRYNFNIRHLTDGKETEDYRGKAELTAAGGKASYTHPADKTAAFPAATLFPSAHTKLIIEKALAGEHFFTRHVFDGSDEEGSDDVSVFIGPLETPAMTPAASDPLGSNPLLAKAAWPVHMAFFKVDSETGEPDYELDLQLLANGVVRAMKIDYGDFTVTGKLSAIEPLPLPHC